MCGRERSGLRPNGGGLRHFLQACERDRCRPPEIAFAGTAPGGVVGIPVSPAARPRFAIDIEAAGCTVEGEGSHCAQPCLPRFFVCWPKALLDMVPDRQHIATVIVEPGERVERCSGHTAVPGSCHSQPRWCSPPMMMIPRRRVRNRVVSPETEMMWIQSDLLDPHVT